MPSSRSEYGIQLADSHVAVREIPGILGAVTGLLPVCAPADGARDFTQVTRSSAPWTCRSNRAKVWVTSLTLSAVVITLSGVPGPRSTAEYSHITNGRIITSLTPDQDTPTRSWYELSVTRF